MLEISWKRLRFMRSVAVTEGPVMPTGPGGRLRQRPISEFPPKNIAQFASSHPRVLSPGPISPIGAAGPVQAQAQPRFWRCEPLSEPMRGQAGPTMLGAPSDRK